MARLDDEGLAENEGDCTMIVNLSSLAAGALAAYVALVFLEVF